MQNKMDIIISLVGFNPIANYISILNYCKKDTKIFLIHSGTNQTEDVAKNIKKVVLNRFNNEVEIKEVKSSKSDFKLITNSLNSVKEDIKNIIKLTEKENLEILLDITGSTKPNSAFAYSILSDLQKDNKVRFYQCYVSNEDEKIYESGYGDNRYLLENIAKESQVKKEEILDLYGYTEYRNTNENIKLIKKMVLENFTLIFSFESKGEKFNEIKEDVFIALDIAERLGGSLSKIFLEAKSFANEKEGLDEEDGQEEFIKTIENGTNKSYEGRIALKSLINGFCNNEEIEECVKGGV